MREGKPDIFFLSALGFLLAFGLLMLFSASSPMAYAAFGDPYVFIKKQFFLGVIPGLIGFFILSQVDYNKLKLIAKPLFLLTLVLLVIILIEGVNSGYGTAKRWIVIAGFSFQMAELAKLSLVIFMSSWLADFKKEDFTDYRKSLIPFLIVIGILGLLIMKQPDMGTFLVIFSIALSIYIAAGAMWLDIMYIFTGALVGFISLIFISQYRFKRLISFLSPETDSLGISYHINQAFLAIGSGGFWGLGWGHSRQKFQYLPQVDADSIFAVIAEELGFLVSTLFIILLFVIFWRGFKIAQNAPNNFGKLLGVGIMIWFISQAVINIGAMVGVFPLTGVTLPLVSHGGSSMLILLFALGIMVNISKQGKDREA